MARLLLGQRKYEMVLSAVEALPLDADVLFLRGASRYELRQYPPAQEDLEAAIRAGKDEAAAWVKLVACRLRLGDAEAARRDLAEALRRHPSDATLQALRARV
jgi:tetratricopeptide (TPR) repeat protein